MMSSNLSVKHFSYLDSSQLHIHLKSFVYYQHVQAVYHYFSHYFPPFILSLTNRLSNLSSFIPMQGPGVAGAYPSWHRVRSGSLDKSPVHRRAVWTTVALGLTIHSIFLCCWLVTQCPQRKLTLKQMLQHKDGNQTLFYFVGWWLSYINPVITLAEV